MIKFSPSFCVHNNTRDQRKKRGRPGSIHHMSGREVDVGMEGPIFIVLKLKASFLLVKTSTCSFDHANIWSPKLR